MNTALTIIIIIIGGIVGVVIYGLIAKKAGYSFWYGLLMIVPLVDFITLIWFAAAKWPVLKKLEAYKAKFGDIEANP